MYVDATLIAALTTAASISASQAVAAAFVYRGVSFILVAIVGWIVFGFLFRGHGRASDVELEATDVPELEQRRAVPDPTTVRSDVEDRIPRSD